MRSLLCITQEDLSSLRAFTQKIDAAMEEMEFYQEDRWGHQDLPNYLPWMGPRYGFVGSVRNPLSVFRGEGLALFLLSRCIQPSVIAECYTGTGYGTAWLAAGSPNAQIFSVDDYSEGQLGKEGFCHTQLLIQRLELHNVTLLHGSIEQLKISLGNRELDLYFSDGPHGEAPALRESVIVIRHDDLNGQAKERSFTICGGSNLSVMCPTSQERNELMAVMSKAFPVERCDA